MLMSPRLTKGHSRVAVVFLIVEMCADNLLLAPGVGWTRLGHGRHNCTTASEVIIIKIFL